VYEQTGVSRNIAQYTSGMLTDSKQYTENKEQAQHAMRTVGHSGSTVWLGSSYQLTKVVNLQHALKGTRLAKEQSIEIKRVHRRHYPMLSVGIYT
jgi:hypothetical protein